MCKSTLDIVFHFLGQCYDGAASMKGEKSGLKTRVLQLNDKALYVHCFGHSLNLAVQDCIKSIPEVQDLLDKTYELTKLIKYSPKREQILHTIKEEVKSSGGGVKSLCLTRLVHPLSKLS